MKNSIKKHIFVLLFCLIIPFIFVGCENSNIETLSSPTVSQVKGGTIVFNQIPNAEYYTLSINNTELNVYTAFNTNVKIIDNFINYDASKIFVTGESYTIKIRANSSTHINSDFSAPISYKHSGTIKTPSEVKINGTTLTWSLVESASYYLVKVLTPNDTIVFDKAGNIISLDDPASISKADLTEYTFNANSFDFGSLLSKAGTYQFYVCAVLSNGTSYVESTYTSKTLYTHYEHLSAPVCGEVYKVNSELHMVAALDPNSNEIAIKSNGVELISSIGYSEPFLTKFVNNYFDINLTQYFSGKVDFSNERLISFALQSRYSTNNPETEFFINSDYSETVFFENSFDLNSPTLVLEPFDSYHIATWNFDNKDKIGAYKLILFKETGEVSYHLTSETTSMIISEDFVAITIQAIEKGDNTRSSFSNFATKEDAIDADFEINVDTVETSLSWNEIENAYYVVEFKNKYEILTETNFNIPTEELKSKNFSIKLHVIKSGYKPLTQVVDLSFVSKLSAPTFASNQGFKSANLYELTFTGSDHAIGYYVYIKSASSDGFEQITTLYTSTTIDLSNYICSKGEYTDYSVKVRAIADYNGIYADSDFSDEISVSHMQVLETPEFYRLNDTTYPVMKEISGSSNQYFLQFYGVRDAGSYEILINFNKITISATNSNFYRVDITNYMVSANNYEIKIRALPVAGSINVEPSSYATTTYTLTKQLKQVQNIKVSENEGVYTLSFDPVDNAESYRVRIVKENDNYYVDYLSSLGLSNSFEVSPSTNISQYVKQQGSYYFYVIALAPKNSYYADANESSEFASLHKLTSLEKPSNIQFDNISKDSYILSWDGDENTDYFLVKITDPNGISHEVKVLNSTSTNINQYITVQGNYKVDIYSMVEPIGETAKEYTSSSATTAEKFYRYTEDHDFMRYKISMFGASYDLVVRNVNDLKSLLWYHYLYELDPSLGLRVMIEPQIKEQTENQTEEENVETIHEAIIRFSEEATTLKLHNFKADETWLYICDFESDSSLFSYICQKLLGIYPEFHILSDFELRDIGSESIFELYYRNSLNVEKIECDSNKFVTNIVNYGNDYNYIDPFSRKSPTGTFNIDARPGALVTTSEQLLQVVQDGYKPVFVGNSKTAETIYANAKLVLSAIVTNKMTELQKVTAIFDWIESEFDLIYYNDGGTPYMAGAYESGRYEEFGIYDHYYLEGMFKNISVLNNGKLVVGNHRATSKSYSKAFALLCAIEGIKVSVINGYYTYMKNSQEIHVDHTWNKVFIDASDSQTAEKNWYSLDLTFSDNRIYFSNLNKGYGISSHTYFLTYDSSTYTNYRVIEQSNLISDSYHDERKCETTYDYYSKSSFGLTLNQMWSSIYDFELYTYTCDSCSHQQISQTLPEICDNCHESNTFTNYPELLTKDFNYSKKLDTSGIYQKYAEATDLGPAQSFYLNYFLYANYKLKNNSSEKTVIEFKVSTDYFNAEELTNFINCINTANLYGAKLERVNDSAGSGTIYSVKDSGSGMTTIVCVFKKSNL